MVSGKKTSDNYRKSAYQNFFNADDGKHGMPFPPAALFAKVVNAKRCIAIAELDVFGVRSSTTSHAKPDVLCTPLIECFLAVIYDDWRLTSIWVRNV
jgi:hypothetical protein